MEIGTYQNLKIKKIVDIGAYLVDTDGKEVLLPKRQLRKDLKVNDKIKVFLYNDSKGRLISTIKNPLLAKGEVASLKCVSKTKIGYFLDIGLERDLFLPFSETKRELNVGDNVKVIMYIDKSNRLCASMYINKFKDKIILDENSQKTKKYILNANKVFKILNEKFGGHLLYTDKNASPNEIVKDFNMSKSDFKASIGKLLKDNKIKITKTGIYTFY